MREVNLLLPIGRFGRVEYTLGMKHDSGLQHVVCAVIVHDGKILITLRNPESHLGNHWEFPGGKVKEEESQVQALVREIFEEVGIHIRVEKLLKSVRHDYGTPENIKKLHLHFYQCRWLEGKTRALQVSDFQWVLPEALSTFRFPPADADFIQELPSLLQKG